MIIHSKLTHLGKTYKLIYRDVRSFDNLPYEKCSQIYGICFYKDKIVIGRGKNKNLWNLIGGTIEAEEALEEALKREVLEESNMEILKSVPIGYQEVFLPQGGSTYQLRSACLVKPLGVFKNDPGNSVHAIKLIYPKDYKKYFDWGEVGERIIRRAIQLKKKF